ncbi:MAG TPA: DUF1440 domain-containing protein [Candidatus Limnocylindrales bacterium]
MGRDVSVFGGLVRGAIGGAVGTWLMDQVTTGLMDQSSDADKEMEAAARPNGQSSTMNLVDLATGRLGLELDEAQRSTAATAAHWALGIVPAALYGALRSRIPGLGIGNGVAFGALLFAANDEYLNAALGLAGPPEAYPASTHFRGLVGHVALGMTVDTVCDLLGG